MMVELDQESLEFAKKLIVQGKVNRTELAWSELAPDEHKKNLFIQAHGKIQYYNWFLAKQIDNESTATPIFLMGNFSQVYLSALKYHLEQAKIQELHEIIQAISDLIELIEDGN